MSEGLIVLLIGVAWILIGLTLAGVMHHRGHLGFGWFAIGTIMGPMAVVFAVDAVRHEPPAVAEVVEPGVPHAGTTDVLVGVDGSPESQAAVEAAVRLFHPGLGRLSLVTVIDSDEPRHSEMEALATARLEDQAARVRSLEPAMELFQATRFQPELVVMRGQPAEALAALALDRDFEVIVIGSRGTGMARSLLGSVAEALAARCPVPVLVITPPEQVTDQSRTAAHHVSVS